MAAAAVVTAEETLGDAVAVSAAVRVALVTAAGNKDVSFEEGNEAEKPSVRGATMVRWASSRQMWRRWTWEKTACGSARTYPAEWRTERTGWAPARAATRLA